MKITSVSDVQQFRYIPLKGWSSVESAIQAYAQGSTPGSRATEHEQVRATTQAGGDLTGLLFSHASAMLGKSIQFVQEMLMEAKTAIETFGHWDRRYDYDGVGTFFKTKVEVMVLDWNSDLYALGIYASYVGDKPEEELAEYLGIQRALIWSSVAVQVEPTDGNHFTFDLEKIARKLDAVFGRTDLSGEIIAQAMMGVTERGDSKPNFVLMEDDDLMVSIYPGRVKGRFHWEDPYGPSRRRVDTWFVEGSVLSGLLDDSYKDKNKKEPPNFGISISKRRKTSWGHENIPVWDEDKKNRIIRLTREITKAFS